MTVGSWATCLVRRSPKRELGIQHQTQLDCYPEGEPRATKIPVLLPLSLFPQPGMGKGPRPRHGTLWHKARAVPVPESRTDTAAPRVPRRFKDLNSQKEWDPLDDSMWMKNDLKERPSLPTLKSLSWNLDITSQKGRAFHWTSGSQSDAILPFGRHLAMTGDTRYCPSEEVLLESGRQRSGKLLNILWYTEQSPQNRIT